MTEDDLRAIEARTEAATPGPWRWELNRKNKQVSLCGGDPRGGFGAYDLTVVDFVRWGMNGAQPRFRCERDIMCDAGMMGRVVEGREHHAEWFQDVAHPDAAFIAAARQDIPRLAAALREAWSDGKRLQDEVAALDAARREAEAAAAEMREALRPLWTAASAYRQQEQDDTPRMCRGKALHDLGIVLDAAIASAEPSIRSPTPGAALLAERDRLREALEEIAAEHDAGRHDGLPEPCPALDADTMFALARAALKETSNG